MHHALIMAGGSGSRLWPLSRKSRPKQLLKLFDGKSLMRIAYERVAPLIDADRVWVVTSTSYIDQVAAELPELPRANLIGEPVGRDTANAIGLALNLIARHDADATVAVLTADHLIDPQDRFLDALRRGFDTVARWPDHLVTFGIRPTEPHTGYGYVHRGEPTAPGVYRVRAFREKPDRATADAYLASGEHLWNSGMFVWRADTLLAELEHRLPENARELAEVAAQWPTHGAAQTPALADRVAARFAELRRISVDYAIMEHAERVLVIDADVHWRDVGSWSALAAATPTDADGNALAATHVAVLESTGNLVVAEGGHLVALLGVHDLVVVHSEHATLVCRRSESERVRAMVEAVTARFGGDHV